MRTPSRTTQLTILAAIGLGIAACESPSGPIVSGACIGMTNIKGINYILDAGASAAERVYNQGVVLGTVARHRLCNDTASPLMDMRMWSGAEEIFEPGDSNMFEVGTKVCEILGESPTSMVMICDRPPSDQRILTARYVREL